MHLGRLVALTLAGSLLAACGGGDDNGDQADPSSASTAADGTTLPGTVLDVGDPAVVQFAPDAKHDSTIQVVVTGVKQGKVKELTQFTLNAAAKASTVYYVAMTVKNLGRANLGGTFVPVYGKVSDSLVVQPVIFGSTFAKCNYQPLPRQFTKGKKAKGCAVLLAPKHGEVSAIEWRGSDGDAPISWTVDQ